LTKPFEAGRCTSPRTLYELAKLQKTKPERVEAIVNGEGEITRSAVASLTKAPRPPRGASRKAVASRRPSSLAGLASELCARLEALIGRMTKPGAPVTSDELATLHGRLAELVSKGGSDRPTPSARDDLLNR
jgi:ParB family chromosome partitioning protein